MDLAAVKHAGASRLLQDSSVVNIITHGIVPIPNIFRINRDQNDHCDNFNVKNHSLGQQSPEFKALPKRPCSITTDCASGLKTGLT